MPFNLVTSAWLDIRRWSGVRAVIAPADVVAGFDADPVIALDFPRADWNGAVTEFLIGLVWLALGRADRMPWADRFAAPPSADDLRQALAPLAPAFDFDGDGTRAFQDLDPLAEADLKPLGGLLIDAPGENTLKNNADLFVKRGGADGLGLAYAAAALVTLQTYAPSGGAGHRTSLRGGGPLTTLLAPVRARFGLATLWDRIWANMPAPHPALQQADPMTAFPWLAPTLTSAKGGPGEVVTPEDRHPALAFFACPRRIRLQLADNVACAFGGSGGRGATGYRTLNYGPNYVSWLHPLSPYRHDKKAGLLPLHPHAGPADYGDWIAWWGLRGAGDRVAEPLKLWSGRRDGIETLLQPGGDSVEAIGFDMDNMKARQWLEARFPWVAAHEEAHEDLRQLLNETIAAADAAARALRFAVRIAWFGLPREAGYRLPETQNIDAVPEPAERLWRDTEVDFRGLLAAMLALFKDGAAATGDLRRDWRDRLRRRALAIFDDTVDLDGLTDVNPRRLLWARQGLSFAFSDHVKADVRRALNLAPAVKVSKSKEVA